MSGCFIEKWVNDLIMYSKTPTMTIGFEYILRKLTPF